MSYSGYENIEHYGNGNYKSLCVNVDTTWVVGLHKYRSLAGETVKFHINGQVKDLVLAEDIEAKIGLTKVKIMKGTKIEFDNDGFIESFVVGYQDRGFFIKNHNWVYCGKKFVPGSRVSLGKVLSG